MQTRVRQIGDTKLSMAALEVTCESIKLECWIITYNKSNNNTDDEKDLEEGKPFPLKSQLIKIKYLENEYYN